MTIIQNLPVPALQGTGQPKLSAMPSPRFGRALVYSTDTASPGKPLHYNLADIMLDALVKRATKTSHTILCMLGVGTNQMRIQQQDLENCYILAALDTLLHSPDARLLLRAIGVESYRDHQNRLVNHCTVTFPSGRRARFDVDSLQYTKDGFRLARALPPLQLLERACIQVLMEDRNQQREVPYAQNGERKAGQLISSGTAAEILSKLFKGRCVDFALGPQTEPFSCHPEGTTRLAEQLNRASKNTKSIYLLTACTPTKTEDSKFIDITETNGEVLSLPRGHGFSIRKVDVQRQSITLADPHDTRHKVHEVSFEQFSQGFQGISGIRIPRGSLKHAPVQERPKLKARV
jgi:hypothetical protein